MRSFVKVSWMVVLAVAVLTPLSAQAARLDASDPLVPAGLVDDDVFHLTFTTSTKQQAKSQDIADYNSLVQGLADAAGFSALSWKAIVSTEAVHAKDNAVVSGAVYRLDDVQVADDAADFWDGSHAAAMNLTETGGAPLNSWTHTGSGGDGLGIAGQHVGNQTHATMIGYSDQHVSKIWLEGMAVGWDNALPFYAISEKIIVGIPEPGTMGLLMLGLVGLLCRRGTHRS